MRWNDGHINGSALITATKFIIVIEYFLVLSIDLLKLFHLLMALFMSIRIEKGKLNSFSLFKIEIEFKHQLFRRIHRNWLDTMRQSLPRGPICGQVSLTENWAIEMALVYLGKILGTVAQRKWTRWIDRFTRRFLNPLTRK